MVDVHRVGIREVLGSPESRIAALINKDLSEGNRDGFSLFIVNGPETFH